MTILDKEFEKQYERFTKICLEKGARFKSLDITEYAHKQHLKYEQLEMESLFDESWSIPSPLKETLRRTSGEDKKLQRPKDSK